MNNVKLIQLCSDRLEFLAETALGLPIDLSQSYEIICSSCAFTSVTHLKSVGVLRAKYKGKSILIFRDGKITINWVKNISEALEVIHSLAKLLNIKS